MPQGTLELLLVSAKGLENTEFIFKMDPYVILTCRSQEQKSSVAAGEGSDPEWNETFVFSITEGVTEIKLKIMDRDHFTSDDFVGEATISLDALFENGNIPPSSYNVVKEGEYCGEIRVGLTFTPESRYEQGYESFQAAEQSFQAEGESFGGWKQSEYTD